MFTPATVAALAPFILGITKASVVQEVSQAHVSPAPYLGQAARTVLGADTEFQCENWNDWDCYQRYWDRYRYCHPYDQNCYKDCDNYDDYWGHCKNYDKDYGQCYDRCYYDHENCDKYKDCHGEDNDCYKKKRRDDYCEPHDRDSKCRDKHDDPKDFCKPWDWECHEQKHGDDDYKCRPEKDKDCYPDYPDYPDYDDDDDDDDGQKKQPEPKHDVIVKFYGHEGKYEMKIWPNGEEHYTEKNKHTVDHIKYWTQKDEHDVRCLPMKNWFPWTPLRIDEYKEQRRREGGWKVRIIRLKKPQPVEVIRCDYP